MNWKLWDRKVPILTNFVKADFQFVVSGIKKKSAECRGPKGTNRPSLPWLATPGMPAHTLCPRALELHLSSGWATDDSAPSLSVFRSVPDLSVGFPSWTLAHSFGYCSLGPIVTLWLCSTCSDTSGLYSAEEATLVLGSSVTPFYGVALLLLLPDSAVGEFHGFKG